MQPEIGKPRGILNQKAGEKRFQLSRQLPAHDLSFFVEFYWSVSWDLRGQEPYVQETLPHPCVHLVFEPGQSMIFGVSTGKFSRLLEGKGRVFSIKFRPGGFYPFVKVPVSRFTDTTRGVEEVFGEEGRALEEAILACADERYMIGLAERFLRERQPERDEHSETISQIVDYIISHPETTRVDNLVEQFQLNKRTLQRIFNQYVGVSPKWVIKRYRLHEAAERAASSEHVDWARLALDLEYFDQAHFIKDFKAIIGKTPAEYARNG